MSETKLYDPFTVNHITSDDFVVDNTALFSKYTNGMNRVIKEYEKERGIDKNTYYLFFVNAPNNELQGFMPLTGQYGFIFNYGNNTTVLAHELAHGAFNLRHTFSDKAQHYFL
jgi:hypothetical protein